MSEQQKKPEKESEKKPEKEPGKKPERTFWFSVTRALAFVLFRTICPARFHYRERVERRRGPFILIGNHKSLIDPVVMAMIVKEHEVRFLGKKEIQKNPFLRWYTNKLHMIPVDRGNTDMEAMRACIRVLREGEVLGIFPEGTRHKQGLMEDLETGTSLIALRANVPLVPMLIWPRIRPFRRVEVLIGEDIPTEDLRAKGIDRETCEALDARITETYAEMARSLSGR